jgi:hypothetical protein
VCVIKLVADGRVNFMCSISATSPFRFMTNEREGDEILTLNHSESSRILHNQTGSDKTE